MSKQYTDEVMHKLGFKWDSFQSEWRNDGRKQFDRDYDDSISPALATQISDFIKSYGIQQRIDEINYLDDNYQENSQDWERDNPGYSTAMIPMKDYINRRNHLTSQLESNKDD